MCSFFVIDLSLLSAGEKAYYQIMAAQKEGRARIVIFCCGCDQCAKFVVRFFAVRTLLSKIQYTVPISHTV